MNERIFFEAALQEAQKAKSICRPNPAVGAVIVKHGRCVAKGHTQRYGKQHAEIDAIDKALKNHENLQEARLYVTLTPCSHYGKTPPCMLRIREVGIRFVYIGLPDISLPRLDEVHRYFSSHGIRWAYGFPPDVMDDLIALNEDFYFRAFYKRPVMHLKYAMTLDGKIATRSGDSKWISSLESRQHVHRLRSEHDALLVGAATASMDNARLTVRLRSQAQSSTGGYRPYRIVVCTRDEFLRSHYLLSGKEKSIFLLKKTFRTINDQVVSAGKDVFVYEKTPYVEEVFCELSHIYSLNSILVEGGSRVQSGLLGAGLVDKLTVYVSPKILADGFYALSPFSNTSKKESSYLIKDANIFQRTEVNVLKDDVSLSLESSRYAKRKKKLRQLLTKIMASSKAP